MQIGLKRCVTVTEKDNNSKAAAAHFRHNPHKMPVLALHAAIHNWDIISYDDQGRNFREGTKAMATVAPQSLF